MAADVNPPLLPDVWQTAENRRDRQGRYSRLMKRARQGKRQIPEGKVKNK